MDKKNAGRTILLYLFLNTITRTCPLRRTTNDGFLKRMNGILQEISRKESWGLWAIPRIFEIENLIFKISTEYIKVSKHDSFLREDTNWISLWVNHIEKKINIQGDFWISLIGRFSGKSSYELKIREFSFDELLSLNQVHEIFETNWFLKQFSWIYFSVAQSRLRDGIIIENRLWSDIIYYSS